MHGCLYFINPRNEVSITTSLYPGAPTGHHLYAKRENSFTRGAERHLLLNNPVGLHREANWQDADSSPSVPRSADSLVYPESDSPSTLYLDPLPIGRACKHPLNQQNHRPINIPRLPFGLIRGYYSAGLGYMAWLPVLGRVGIPQLGIGVGLGLAAMARSVD